MVAVDSGGQPTHYEVRLRRELYAQSSLDHEVELKSYQKTLLSGGVRVYEPKLWK
jgi:hypothetical protein